MQIPPRQAFSYAAPTLAAILTAPCLHSLPPAPEEVRESPEHTGGRRRAQSVRAIAHREVGDERRSQVDGEAGVGPRLEPRRRRRQQYRHAEQLGPPKLHPEVVGEAE